MKKKKWIIIAICFLIIISGITIIVIAKNKNKQVVDTSLLDASKQYFNDTKSNITSVMALLENDYLDSTKENKCDILELIDDNVKFKENNCELATEIAKKPVILINTTNDFAIDKWNKKGTTLSFKLKNDGNSYYKLEDIKSVSWISLVDNTTNEYTKKISDKNIVDKYELLVEFNDLVITYNFDVLVDMEAPKLINKELDGEIFAEYEDNYELNNIYYFISKDNKAPQVEDMSTNNNISFECNETYYAWSYATDKAGNSSNIDYLGSYTNICEKPSVSGSK